MSNRLDLSSHSFGTAPDFSFDEAEEAGRRWIASGRSTVFLLKPAGCPVLIWWAAIKAANPAIAA